MADNGNLGDLPNGSERTRLRGSCHCGNLELVLETLLLPAELSIRADQCSFCVKHGARSTTDPEGRARLGVRERRELLRYRFGLRTADFWICWRCGVYVGAVLSSGDGSWATLNVNTFDRAGEFRQQARPVSRDAETAEARIARRKTTWTPVLEIREAE